MIRPDIFNDGLLSEQPFKKAKAFTGVGNVEIMSKERCGAAKWMKGQPRIYYVNDFDSRHEIEDDLPIVAKRAGQIAYVSHDKFMKMLEVASCRMVCEGSERLQHHGGPQAHPLDR